MRWVRREGGVLSSVQPSPSVNTHQVRSNVKETTTTTTTTTATTTTNNNNNMCSQVRHTNATKGTKCCYIPTLWGGGTRFFCALLPTWYFFFSFSPSLSRYFSCSFVCAAVAICAYIYAPRYQRYAIRFIRHKGYVRVHIFIYIRIVQAILWYLCIPYILVLI